jgi:hypothetical protein
LDDSDIYFQASESRLARTPSAQLCISRHIPIRQVIPTRYAARYRIMALPFGDEKKKPESIVLFGGDR